jgi:hypothetical protein
MATPKSSTPFSEIHQMFYPFSQPQELFAHRLFTTPLRYLPNAAIILRPNCTLPWQIGTAVRKRNRTAALSVRIPRICIVGTFSHAKVVFRCARLRIPRYIPHRYIHLQWSYDPCRICILHPPITAGEKIVAERILQEYLCTPVLPYSQKMGF